MMNKPLRKKTKLNLLNEPLTSSRLAVYDEQINTTSSSSNQTTPRSIHPQQIKSKPSTTLSHYSNPEQIRAQVNRSVVERQHLPPPPPPPRRGLIQQVIPFDASPSKVNNLLLRHQHNPPTIHFHPSNSTSRSMKQTLPVLHNEETLGNISEEKSKQIKTKEYDQKKRSKEKELSFERNLRKKIHQNRFIEDDQRYGSGHSIGKTFDRRQRNLPPTNIYRSDGELIKPTRMSKPSSRISDISNQYGSDYSHRSQRNILVDANPRSRKLPSDMSMASQVQIDSNQQKILSQGKLTRPTDLRPREREISRLSNLSKTDSMSINDQPPIKLKILKKTSLNPLPPKSPTSSSIISSHPHSDIINKTNSFQPELPLSPSSHDEFLDENLNTHCRTYRLMTDEKPLDGRHVIPSTQYVFHRIFQCISPFL